jgi:protein SCO1/2
LFNKRKILPGGMKILISVCLFLSLNILGVTLEQPFGLIEKQGSFLPENITVINEDSIEINLNSLINKPTLLSFVYFHCPQLCPKVMDGIAELVNHSQAIPGLDYQIITISIDNDESSQLARKSKLHYTGEIKKKTDPYFWRFFTADSMTIRKLTDSTGWEFRRMGDHFIHTTSTILLTPKGMISQYFYGTYFNYMHFDMSLEKAKQEQIVPTRLKTLKYCYNFQPSRNKLVDEIAITSGIILILATLSLFLVLVYKPFSRK